MNRLAAALALVLLPSLAGADYLYSAWRNQEHEKPFVYVVLDTSISMTATDKVGEDCPYGGEKKKWKWWWRWECYTRFQAAQAVLLKILPDMADDLGLGLGVFAPTAQGGVLPTAGNPWASDIPGGPNAKQLCGMRNAAPLPSDYNSVQTAIEGAQPNSATPLAWSMESARLEIERVRAAAADDECREYYVLLLTDGEETCYADREAAVTEIAKLRAGGVRTFVVGFGPDVAGSEVLSKMARAGGTAVDAEGEFVCWDDESCARSDAHALFAAHAEELEQKLTEALDEVRTGTFSVAEPVIASVPQAESEIDRVARNLMVYSAFSSHGGELRGHLYGLRLFQEGTPYRGDWTFTDMSSPELLEDCGPGKTCVFDAGAMLAVREKPRRILTGSPGAPLGAEGGLTVPMRGAIELGDDEAGAAKLLGAWTDWASIEPIAAALADDALPPSLALPAAELRQPDAARMRELLTWLHGSARPWPLADVYHSSPAIVEPPSLAYLDRGYPQYRRAAALRPWMIYVGANDGMIHAFHASPDLDWEAAGEQGPRWQPGEEAWAYLPLDMVGRALHEVADGSARFFSQDLSCRYVDAILDDKMGADGKLDCEGDPACGWGTVLVCGQGWGGSWYVGIDVSDPANPRPLWELTVPGPETAGGADGAGLGRTWSLPSIVPLRYQGAPRWVGVFGNGYNADMADCPTYHVGSGRCMDTVWRTQSRRASYRLLNLPFEGQYPHHGDGTAGDAGHAWAFDLASGELMRTLHLHESGGDDAVAVLADPASIDSDFDGFADAAYLGGMDGGLYRLSFGERSTGGPDDIRACGEPIVRMGSSRPLTANPAVVSHPAAKDRVYLFLGSGIDGGTDPDQQHNRGNQWDFRAFAFLDDGSSTCPGPLPNAGNVCDVPDWRLDDRARLLGQPVLSRQTSGHDWVVYTTWTPPEDRCSGAGVARLWCLDVTDPGACGPCGDLTGDGTADRETTVDTGGVPPSAPALADQNVYVGPIRTPIVDAAGNPPRPNSRRPRTVLLSWREVFE